jgi:hypothetical protein
MISSGQHLAARFTETVASRRLALRALVAGGAAAVVRPPEASAAPAVSTYWRWFRKDASLSDGLIFSENALRFYGLDLLSNVVDDEYWIFGTNASGTVHATVILVPTASDLWVGLVTSSTDSDAAKSARNVIQDFIERQAPVD